jgi:hypothetical protein
LAISIALPLWGGATVALGIEQRSPGWIATGVITVAIGIVTMIGSPAVYWFFED